MARLRLSLRPNPFAADAPAGFAQTLHLPNATIVVQAAGGVRIALWIDASSNTLLIEAHAGAVPRTVTASFEVWRNTTQAIAPPAGDLGFCQIDQVIRPADKLETVGASAVAVYHRNELDEGTFPYESPANRSSLWDWTLYQQTGGEGYERARAVSKDMLTNRTFGAVMGGLTCTGCSWKRVDDRSVQSSAATSFAAVQVSVLTAQTPSGSAWLSKAAAQAAAFKRRGIEAARRDHSAWWSQFWQEAWVSVPSETGVPPEQTMSAQHAIHRFVTACQGRPKDTPNAMIKFNGGIWVPDPILGCRMGGSGHSQGVRCDADFRFWGGG